MCSYCDGFITLQCEDYEACSSCVSRNPHLHRYECTYMHMWGSVGNPMLDRMFHRHRLVREVLDQHVDTARLEQARCTSNALAIAFELFAPRPCLGRRVRDGTTGELCNEYDWWSYAEVGTQVRMHMHACACSDMHALHDQTFELAAALRHVAPSGDTFIGVLGAELLTTCMPCTLTILSGAISPFWLIADYACMVGGLPSVLMHRTTTAEQLQVLSARSNVRSNISIECSIECCLTAHRWRDRAGRAHCLAPSRAVSPLSPSASACDHRRTA